MKLFFQHIIIDKLKKDLIKAIDMLQIYLGYLEVETTKQTITEEVKKCGYQDQTSPMK